MHVSGMMISQTHLLIAGASAQLLCLTMLSKGIANAQSQVPTGARTALQTAVLSARELLQNITSSFLTDFRYAQYR